MALGPGAVEEYDWPLVMCWSGLHASPRAIDALAYAPGAWVRRVDCGGDIVAIGDKLVCTRRTIVAHADASDVLSSWARWCALQVADLWCCPVIVREWLETGDPALRADALTVISSGSPWPPYAVLAAMDASATMYLSMERTLSARQAVIGAAWTAARDAQATANAANAANAQEDEAWAKAKAAKAAYWEAVDERWRG